MNRSADSSHSSFRFLKHLSFVGTTWFVWVLIFGIAKPVKAQDANEPIALSGLSESQTYEVVDAKQLELSNQFLLKLLHRSSMASPKSLKKYRIAGGSPAFESLIDDPRKNRFLVCEIAGEVISIQKRQPPNRTLPLYILQGRKGEQRFDLYVNKLPPGWEKNFQSPQPIRIDAFFLKTEPDSQSAFPVFVGNTPEWYPIRTDLKNSILPAHLVLAKNGFDASLLHQIRSRNTQPMAAADTASFYQLLATTKDLTSDQFDSSPVEFNELVKDSQKNIGNLTRIRGNVRRCVEVKLEAAEQIDELGADRYYEIDMFFNIGSQQIVINNSKPQNESNDGNEEKTKPKPLIYEDRFPVTVVTTKLPGDWKPDDLAKTQVEIEGIFYRFWKYDAEKTGNETRQIAPLVMGIDIQVVDLSERPLDLWLSVGGLVVFFGILGLFLYIRYSDSVAEQAKAEVLPEKIEVPDDL